MSCKINGNFFEIILALLMNPSDDWQECREMLKRYYLDIEGQIAKIQQKMDQLENLPQQQGTVCNFSFSEQKKLF